MRIDSNQTAAAFRGNGSGDPRPASGSRRSLAGSPLGEDQAQVSGIYVEAQALTAQAAQLPEIREEKVNALRQAVSGGSYQPGAAQVAEGLFAYMTAKAA
jgi:flagellar biosynthesis anti-sigma factor FlgM